MALRYAPYMTADFAEGKLTAAPADLPPPMVLIDNTVCLGVCKGAPEPDAWFWYSKAVGGRTGLLMACADAGLITFTKIDTKLNRADGLTKAFPVSEFVADGKAQQLGVWESP